MAHHQATPKPLLQRILANPIFYLLLAIVVFSGLVKYVKKTPLNPMRTGNRIEATNPVTGGGGPTATEPARKNRTGSEAPTRFLPQTAEPSNSNPATIPQVASGAPGTSGSPSPEPAKVPTQVEVSFFEVPRKSWQPLATEGRTIFEQPSLRVVSFANRDKILSLVGFSRRLPSGASFANQPASTHQFLFPAGRQPDSNQALILDFSVVKNEIAAVELELVLQVDLKHEGGTETHVKLGTVLPLPTNGALAMTQFLPHKPLPEAASPIIANTPLSVLDSADYIEGGSELIGLIHGK